MLTSKGIHTIHCQGIDSTHAVDIWILIDLFFVIAIWPSRPATLFLGRNPASIEHNVQPFPFLSLAHGHVLLLTTQNTQYYLHGQN
jgi:hypothetical protein